ncbi:MAG: gluconate 2-dehydrogenase subunit 3 family protein [Thalassotalea sp.]
MNNKNPDEINKVSRRKFIAHLSLLIGASLSPLGLQSLAAAATYTPTEQAHFLSASQKIMLGTITDIIIPDTDTPGASKAGVPEFIEHMLAKFLSGQEAKAWLTAFIAFDQSVNIAGVNGISGFNALSKKQQLEAVTTLDNHLGQDSFYAKLKELTVIGYYTSKIGASIELQYDPVPGPYREIPSKDIDRAWS